MSKGVRVLYLCDFNLSRFSGKDRATRQKLSALRSKVSEFYLVSDESKSFFSRCFSIFFLDIKAAMVLLRCKPNVFISRGYCGFIGILVAKLMSVITIREVHANAIEEAHLLPYHGLKLLLIKWLARWAHMLDLWVDVRIFNHPDLLSYYEDKKWTKKNDFYTYNGFDADSKSCIVKKDARIKFGIPLDAKVIVFVGAASKWHGVDYLVNLKRCFDEHKDNVEVVFGGGNICQFDPDNICVNISPLDDNGCAELIRSSDLCALPVKNNRVSPGSPLKLYDYIVNERFVLAQSCTNGYSDEVERLGVGVAVDFSCPEAARLDILQALTFFESKEYPECAVSWDDRVDIWLRKIDSL